MECGNKADEGATFCNKCGTKLIVHVTKESTHSENNTSYESPNETIWTDFKKLWSVVAGVFWSIVCLVVYALNGYIIIYWISIVGLVLGMLPYMWHLIKFFLHNSKEIKSLETSKFSRKTLGFRVRVFFNGFGVLALAGLVVVSIFAFNLVSSRFHPEVNQIRLSYLTQFSTSRNINDAFDRFLESSEWRRIRDGGTTYVEVSGMGRYDGNRAHIRVRFELLGEVFVVDSIRINGSRLNLFQQAAFLETVFNQPLSQSRLDDFRFDVSHAVGII